MKRGAVAILDALGFKGLCKPAEANENTIFDKLEKLRDRVNSSFESPVWSKGWWKIPGVTYDPLPRLEAQFAFDSIFAACWCSDSMRRKPVASDGGDDIDLLAALHALCAKLSHMLALGVASNYETGEPGLCYRGAVAVGEFDVRGPFILGPAVNEAATCEPHADGAFVWLTSRANDLASRVLRPRINCLVRDYPVPTKCGIEVRTAVVNPLAFPAYANIGPDVLERMMRTFESDRDDVRRKRDNTLLFLRKALDTA